MKRVMIFWVVFVFGLMVLLGIKLTRESKKDSKVFYSSRLAGRIKDIDSYKGRVTFHLNNSTIDYRFNPTLIYVHGYEYFVRGREVGDSIFKAAFSDTLYLIKKSDGDIIKFTFDKPEDESK